MTVLVFDSQAPVKAAVVVAAAIVTFFILSGVTRQVRRLREQRQREQARSLGQSRIAVYDIYPEAADEAFAEIRRDLEAEDQ